MYKNAHYQNSTTTVMKSKSFLPVFLVPEIPNSQYVSHNLYPESQVLLNFFTHRSFFIHSFWHDLSRLFSPIDKIFINLRFWYSFGRAAWRDPRCISLLMTFLFHRLGAEVEILTPHQLNISRIQIMHLFIDHCQLVYISSEDMLNKMNSL